MDQVVIILQSGVVVVGKPLDGVATGASYRGRRLEVANATIYQGGNKTATAGHLEIDGGAIASVGDRGVKAH